ncbi:MAG: hypothetical protein AAGB22_08240, partial [Bacteroidota bacterium]
KDFRDDADQAEVYYKRAIEADPNQANNLGNYAIFLKVIRQDFDQAEEYYRRATENDPNNAERIGSYAFFLSDVQQNFPEADQQFEKAYKLAAQEPNLAGNYAHHKIVAHRDFEAAERLIDAAFTIEGSLGNGLLAELWFYRYAHYAQYLDTAATELDQLIANGARSPGWNLQPHVEIARENEHPDPTRLQGFADAIAKEE